MHVVCGIKDRNSVSFDRKCALFVISVVNEYDIGEVENKVTLAGMNIRLFFKRNFE